MNLKNTINAFSELLPAKVDRVEWVGDQLIIEGEAWSIVLATCWWRIVKADHLLFGCTDENANEVKSLVGLKVVKIEVQSRNIQADLAMSFSNETILEFFSTSSLDPWSIAINGKPFFSNPSVKQ